MTRDDMFKLTDKQIASIKKLDAAIKEVNKSGLLIVNVYGDLKFYKRNIVSEYCDDSSLSNTLIPVHDAAIYGDADFYIHAPGGDSWADDEYKHKLNLTEKGWKIWNENN